MVVMRSPLPPMTMFKEAVAVCGVGLAESVTVTLNVVVPGTVGVPVRMPPVDRVSPLGRPLAVQEYGVVPPTACIVVAV